ncbi:MAG TPA: hypothetical protein VIS96_00255 [Terrimicrobiaceae bacterium]
MTTNVGIFDNAQDLERAVERLAAAGFEDTVYDEAILSREVSNLASPSAPRPGSDVLLRSVQPNLSPRVDRHTVVRAFRNHLAEYHLPEEVIEAYTTTFYHNGAFILVRTEAARAEQAMQILRDCGATRVNRHDL